MKKRPKRKFAERKILKKARKALRKRNEVELRNYRNYKSFENEDEYIDHLTELGQRLQSEGNLNREELRYYCMCLSPAEKVNVEQCSEHTFYTFYLDHVLVNYNFNLSKNYSFQEWQYIYRIVLSPEAQQRRTTFINAELNAWRGVIYSNDLTVSRLYIEVRKEAKEMIKKMQKTLIKEKAPQVEIQKREDEIILRSKAVYIKAKQILEDIEGSNILKFLGEDIEIGERSIVHIMFRHYAQITKQFNDYKSHFSFEIPTEFLIEHLKKILVIVNETLINKTPINKLSDLTHNSMFFRYYGRLYRIYFKQIKKSSASKKSYKQWIVSTWYPVQQAKELREAENLKIIESDDYRNYLSVLT